MMTLEEAIKHCEEKSDCTECGAEHKQLAEWLRELKAMLERERNINEYLDRDMIKALRCLASQYRDEYCYKDTYNFTNPDKQPMTCTGGYGDFIPCPYHQNKYETSFDGECREWLNIIADESEKPAGKYLKTQIPIQRKWERLTTNKDVSEMSMIELAHNSCYAKDGSARYRDYDLDIDARELARKLLKEYADGDDAFICDEDFDECMLEYLQYGMDSMEGLSALFYRNLWAMADLRERLKCYEDTGLTPEEIMDGKLLSGWILVEERLPDKGGIYLVTAKENELYHTTFVRWQSRCKKWDLTGARAYWRVIAWMPLQEPYRPEK